MFCPAYCSAEEQVTSLAKTSGGAGFGALVGEELSITDTIETVVTGSVESEQRGSFSSDGEADD